MGQLANEYAWFISAQMPAEHAVHSLTFGMRIQLACDIAEDLAAYDLTVLLLLCLHCLFAQRVLCVCPAEVTCSQLEDCLPAPSRSYALTSRNLRRTSLASLSSTVDFQDALMRSAHPPHMHTVSNSPRPLRYTNRRIAQAITVRV